MVDLTPNLPVETHESDLELELENILVTESCDVIRRKIRTLIDNGEMKVGEFRKEINVSGPSYSRFMGQSGSYKGAGSDVYMSAWAFFKKRELRGIKTKPKAKPKTNAAGKADTLPSVEDIELTDEEDDSVQVYDTCDDIRRKINAHLKKPGVTQASFLRNVSASFKKAPKKLTSPQLSAFRSKKGAYEGNTAAIFYGAYVYLEKLRIKEGKPKSNRRLEMEDIHAIEGGIDTKRHIIDSTVLGMKDPV